MLVGGAITLAGLAVGIVDIVQWMVDGVWAPRSVASALGSPPLTAWRPADQVIDWLWARGLWGTVAGAGLMLALAGSAVE